MLSTANIDRLRDDLLAADYTLDGLAERLGPAALDGLARNSSVAASRALGDAADPQAAAIRLWLLQQPVASAALVGWGSLTGLRDAGLVTGGGRLQATVELKPHGSDRREGWICSDATPLDGTVGRPKADFVLGASPASTTLAQLVPPGRYRRALDLGTGCGIQALHLDAEEIVATDLNPRALELARISLGLSGVRVDLRLGSLYDPVAGEGFDLIATNPPYVMSPPTGNRLVYREGSLTGDDLVRQVVTGGADHLAEGGMLTVLGNWAVTAGQPWPERLADWIRPTGCDALVLQRELLDPFEYIEIWLTDAGLAGTPDYLDRYTEWLDYFAAAGIEAVGMGWIGLRKSGREHPELTGSRSGRTPSTSPSGRPSATSSPPSSLPGWRTLLFFRGAGGPTTGWCRRPSALPAPPTRSTLCCDSSSASDAPWRSTPRSPRSSAPATATCRSESWSGPWPACWTSTPKHCGMR